MKVVLWKSSFIKMFEYYPGQGYLPLSEWFVHSMAYSVSLSLQWRHNGRGGVSNHRRLDCLLSRLFRRISKKTLKLRFTGLGEGRIHRWPMDSPHKGPVTRKMFPFDDVIMVLPETGGASAHESRPPWWCRGTETLSALLTLCEGNTLDGLSPKWPVLQGFSYVFLCS